MNSEFECFGEVERYVSAWEAQGRYNQTPWELRKGRISCRSSPSLRVFHVLGATDASDETETIE